MRAFLSHSSTDKPLIEEVAAHLKRARVWLDRTHIETASDIRDALSKGLESSDVFVLFASKKSLESEWVKWEVTLAEKQMVAGRLGRICAFFLEDTLRPADLPTIFQNVHVRHERSPKVIAQEIVRLIQESQAVAHQSLFVGRANEIAECTRVLTDAVAGETPSALILYGLYGIGRRATVGQFARNALGLTTKLELQVALGDKMPEVIVSLESMLGVRLTEVEISSRLKSLHQEAEPKQISTLATSISSATERGALVTFVDQGGLIDDEGLLTAWVNAVAAQLASEGLGQFAVVSRRRPVRDPASTDYKIPSVRVPELSVDDSVNLLAALLRKRQVKFSMPQVRELAAQVSGYPPAAYYAAEVAKQDGIAMLLADTSGLGRVTEARFLKLLESDHRLDGTRQKLLRLLANYSPLPLDVVGDYLDLDPKGVHECMEYLLDTGLAYPAGIHYKIADPMVRAVSRLYGIFDVDHGKVAELVAEHMELLDEDDIDRLNLTRVYFRAAQMAGGHGDRRASIVQFASDQISVAMELYHDRKYDRAAKVANEALIRRPDLADVRDYLVRSLIQLEKYEDAEAEIKILENQGRGRDAAFLLGFMHRKRGYHKEAITSYLRSLDLGRRGLSIHRELAQCYFEQGDLREAERYVENARKLDHDNRYLVDLQCQIATRLGDKSGALELLKILEYVDRPEYFAHRKSVVLSAFGDIWKALDAARAAFAAAKSPTFEIYTQFIKMLIENGHYGEARKKMDDLDSAFRGIRRDIRKGLRCKLLIAEGKFDDALILWSQLESKSAAVHRSLRMQIIEGKKLDGKATPEEIAEAEAIRRDLGYNIPHGWDWFEE